MKSPSSKKKYNAKHTPTRKRHRIDAMEEHLAEKGKYAISNLSGKGQAKRVNKVLSFSTSTKNKCAIGKEIYESKSDKALKKKHGKSNTWIGCDNEACEYWVHARCANIKLAGKTTNRQNLFSSSCSQISFLCYVTTGCGQICADVHNTILKKYLL